MFDVDDYTTKLVFIAGPYTGTPHQIERNIYEAREFAIKLANAGIYYICPHLNSANFDTFTNVGEDFYKLLDLRLLSYCDVLAYSPRWESSAGTRAEREYATWNNIPEYCWTEFDELVEFCK